MRCSIRPARRWTSGLARGSSFSPCHQAIESSSSPTAFFGRYVPSGHIVYMQDSSLLAVPFDRQRLEILGPAGRVMDGVKSESSRGSAQLAASEAGTFAYLPGAEPL